MRVFPATPKEMVASIWRHRTLIITSAKREILGRYKGSALGLFWSLFNPLLMLTVYTFVFSVVFQAKWGSNNGSKGEFALLLFAGLIVFNLFSECINRAPNLILSNPNYVKKVVFPLEILPFVVLIAAAYHMLVSLAVWLAAYVLLFGIPHLAIILIPIILIPFGLFILGLSWMLASLGVFLRDVGQIIAIFITVLLFLSPIFYPASALPEAYRTLFFLNPLTPIIEMMRDALYWGRAPSAGLLGVYWLAGSFVAWAGFAWFQKTRKGFADVL